MTEFQKFLEALERNLMQRYQQCPPNATADTILLAVANAISDARHETFDLEG